MYSHILIAPIERCIWHGNTKKKYCFKCRKHLIHHKVTIVWGGETGQWYEPNHTLCCSQCEGEHLTLY